MDMAIYYGGLYGYMLWGFVWLYVMGVCMAVCYGGLYGYMLWEFVWLYFMGVCMAICYGGFCNLRPNVGTDQPNAVRIHSTSIRSAVAVLL
jgi:hypothetical protein